MESIMRAVRPSKIERVAGSGNKFVHMVEELSEYYINLVPGFKSWDMCGSEVLINSRFGIISDARKRPLLYNPYLLNHTLRDGIIAARTR
jgi:3'-phosphoadenosine 5'-phosphosulfate (PAPS) 3'-phosphatase